MNVLQQIAAALYLAAGVGALLAVTLPARRMERGAVIGLALGAVAQTAFYATLHRADSVPPLASLPAAFGLTAWMAVLFFLAFMGRVRLPGLAAVVGFTAFLSVFAGAISAGLGAPDETVSEGGLPHAHVLLASAGLALMGIAGLSGLFFLLEHRRLKQKRRVAAAYPMPSLEALDRVNVVSLGIGFPLLTLGVVTGSLWVMHERGVLWLGTSHETWTIVAWAIYGGLVLARFAGHQAGRQAAASALGGFAFLLFAVVGVELFT